MRKVVRSGVRIEDVRYVRVAETSCLEQLIRVQSLLYIYSPFPKLQLTVKVTEVAVAVVW